MPRKRGRACGTIATQSLSSSIGVGGERNVADSNRGRRRVCLHWQGSSPPCSMAMQHFQFLSPLIMNQFGRKKRTVKCSLGHGLLTTSIVQPKFSMGPGEGVSQREQSVFYAALPMSCLITEFRLGCYCLDLVDFAYTPLLSWCKHLTYSVHKFRLSRLSYLCAGHATFIFSQFITKECFISSLIWGMG